MFFLQYFIIHIVNIKLMMASYILEFIYKLDCDTRTSIYTAVTGIVISIIIFASGIVSNRKNEMFYKKLLLKNTKIKEHIRDMLILLAVIWISQAISNKSLLYIACQILINIGILASMAKIYKSFIYLIKLMTADTFYEREKNKYIKQIMQEYNKCEENHKIIQEKNTEELKEKINSMPEIAYKKYYYMVNENYEEIYSGAEGIIHQIDYDSLMEITHSIGVKTNVDINNVEKVNDNKTDHIICINVVPDERVSKDSILAYIRSENNEYIEKVRAAFLVKPNTLDIEKDIERIFLEIENKLKNTSNIYSIAEELFELVEYIINKKLNYVEDLLFYMVERLYEASINSKKIRENTIFVTSEISNFYIIHNKIEYYKKYSKLNTALHKWNITEKNINKKEEMSKFGRKIKVQIFMIEKYCDDIKYYEYIMSRLLIIIKELILTNNYDAILVLFDNLGFYFRQRYLLQEEKDKKDIIELQFVTGIFLYICYNFEQINKAHYNSIRELVKMINESLLQNYTVRKLIFAFKNNIRHNTSEIENVYSDIEIEMAERKNPYASMWTGGEAKVDLALVFILCTCNLWGKDSKSIEEYNIDKDDVSFCDNLLDTIESKSEEYLKITDENIHNMNLNDAKQELNDIKLIAQEKGEEYTKTHSISENKMSEFVELTYEEINKKNELLNILNNSGKIQENSTQYSMMLGINQLIPRNLFFDETIGMESFPIEFAKAINKEKSKKILEILNNSAINIEEANINNVIDKFKDIKNVIIIAGFTNKWHIAKDNSYYTYNNHQIPIIQGDTDGVLILETKSLPEVIMHNFSNEFNKEHIKENTFVELIDCATNKKVRKNIINSAEWIKEKGDAKAQDEYLKGWCNIRIEQCVEIRSNVKGLIYKIKKLDNTKKL